MTVLMNANGILMTTEQALDHLRAAILEALAPQTLGMAEIKAHPDLQGYIKEHGWTMVRKLVFALTDSGLLYRSGTTKGALYRTTRLGRDTIGPLRNRQYTGLSS